MSAGRLRLVETYPAILGESEWAGLPGLIVRLAGCNLRCSYCDSPFAQTGGRAVDPKKIIERARRAGLKRVLVTGGEPLLQAATPALLAALARAGFAVMLETNGSLDLTPVPDPVHIVMDLKTPGSGCEAANLLANLNRLKPDDEIKIVITGRPDYLWARRAIADHQLQRFPLTLSPATGRCDPAELARWMLADRLPARLGLQLHKYIFGEDRRRT
jgi:7-carboxy-7-deazaguanine synthase